MTTYQPRILYVLSSKKPSENPIEHVETLTAELSSEFESFVLSVDEDTISLESAQQNIANFPASKILWPFTPYRGELSEKAVEEALARVKPDIIHIQHFSAWPFYVLEQFAQTGKPVLVTLHDYYAISPAVLPPNSDTANKTISREYAESIFQLDISDYLKKRRTFISKGLALATKIIAPSEEVAKKIGKVFESNPLVLSSVEPHRELYRSLL